jgi:hypothetical protein
MTPIDDRVHQTVTSGLWRGRAWSSRGFSAAQSRKFSLFTVPERWKFFKKSRHYKASMLTRPRHGDNWKRNGPHPTTCFGDPTVIFRNVGVISAAPCITVMRSWLTGTGNTSIYEAKNSCSETLYIFWFRTEKVCRMVRNSSCTMILF